MGDWADDLAWKARFSINPILDGAIPDVYFYARAHVYLSEKKNCYVGKSIKAEDLKPFPIRLTADQILERYKPELREKLAQYLRENL